jgi:hypothetical protein
VDEHQQAIRNRIRDIVASGDSDEITYQSEWLGYLPFPVDHWVEHQGKTFSGDFPFDWTLEDLASLERIGFLEQLEAYENPEDRFDRCIRFRVHIGCA